MDLGKSYGFNTRNLNGQVGLIEYGTGEESMGILVHCDVVPAGNGWDTDPFELTRIEGKLFGRGTIDDKGPALACLHGMKQLRDSGFEPNRKIQMIIGTDEETLWRGIDQFVKNEKLPELGFTPDGNFPLIHAEKGILDFDLLYDFDNMQITKGVKLKSLTGGMSRNSVADQCRVEFQANTDHQEIIYNKIRNKLMDTPITIKVENDEDGMSIVLTGKYCHAMHPEKGINAINYCMLLLEEITDGGSVFQTYGEKIGLDIYGDKETQPLVIGGGTYARVLPNTVSFGPVYPDQVELAHEANEYIEEAELIKLIDIYGEAIKRLANIVL